MMELAAFTGITFLKTANRAIVESGSFVLQSRRSQVREISIDCGHTAAGNVGSVLTRHGSTHDAASQIAERLRREPSGTPANESVLGPSFLSPKSQTGQDPPTDPARIDAIAAPADTKGNVRRTGKMS
jgi:hypothetical protein